MGKVVELDASAAKERTKARSKGASRRRPRRSKTALVLGGGGFTGGVYEIGALRALDLLVGQPDGQPVRRVRRHERRARSSPRVAANGVTPEEMMRVINQQVPTPFRDVDLGDAAAAQLPRACAELGAAAPVPRGAASRATSRVSSAQVSAVDVAVGLAEALPSGLYTGAASSATCEQRARRIPTAPTTSGCSSQRALPRRDRPRHLRADRVRRRGLGRRADRPRRRAPRRRCR